MKHDQLKKTLSIALFFIGLAPCLVFADEGRSLGPEVSFAPHTVELSVLPGQKIEGAIKVKNTGDLALPFVLSVVNFTAHEESGDMVIDNDFSGGLKQWIKFKKSEIFIDPQTTQRIEYEMSVPSQAAPGGYYAMAIFDSNQPQLSVGGTESRVLPGLGVLFLVSIEGGERLADPIEIEKFEIIDEKRVGLLDQAASYVFGTGQSGSLAVQVLKSADPEFEIKLRNRDAYHAKVSGSIGLKSSMGKDLGALDIPPMTILPGKARVFKVANPVNDPAIAEGVSAEVSDPVRLSSPVVKAAMDLRVDREKEKKENKWLFVLGWRFYLLTLLILMFLFLFWKKRKEASHAFGKIFKKPHKKGIFDVDKKA